MSEEGVKRVAEALTTRGFADEVSKKAQREIAARAAIIRSIEKWTGYVPNEMGWVPLVRHGKFIGYEEGVNYLDVGHADRIKRVTFGVWSEDRKTLQLRLEHYKKLRDALGDVLRNIADMSDENVLRIPMGEYPSQDDIHAKLLFSIGYISATWRASIKLSENLNKAIGALEHKLGEHRSTRGRPRSAERYDVAREFALLFQHITGERPTYSKGRDGFSGKFTPALADLFKAIGWQSSNLEGPAKAACEAAKAKEIWHPKNRQPTGLLGGLFSLPDS